MMTDNKPKRIFRQNVVVPVVAAGGLLVGTAAGILARPLTERFIRDPAAERLDAVEISDQPESFLSGLQSYVDSRIQSGLNDIKNEVQQLYGQLESLDRELDSYGKLAGANGGGFAHTQDDLRELQSNLRELRQSVENNSQKIQRVTDRSYGQQFVTLSQVESRIASIPKVSDREIRNVVETTLRNHRLIGAGAYGTIDAAISNVRRDIDRIDRSVGDMRRDIDNLERKVD